MDLGAYTNIENLEGLMKANGISVPRLRGLRLMKNEKRMTEDEINAECYYMELHDCEDLCYSNFIVHSNWKCFSRRTDKICNHYLIRKGHEVIGIRWNVLHGKKRKLFKRCLKDARKRVRKVYDTFNKYAGRDDILYIHARIGGANWGYYGGAELAKQPWFIEKVDDASDCTYCDIYARIKEVKYEL